MEFLTLYYWWILFGISSIMVVLLGIREAHRPWILKSNYRLLFTWLSIILLIIWIACIFTALIKLGLMAGIGLSLLTLTIGIISLYVFKRRGYDAEITYSQQRETDAINVALRNTEILNLLESHSLDARELTTLRQLLLRLGVNERKANNAVRNAAMVQFYLERKATWSRDDWIQLTVWIKTGRRN